MTEQTPVIDPASAVAAPGAPASASPAAGAGHPAGTPPAGKRPDRPDVRRSNQSTLVAIVIMAVLLCVALGSALWYQRKQFISSGREVALRLDTMNAALEQSRKEAREAINLSQSESGKVTALEAAARESQSQYTALEQALRSLNDTGGDAVLANDVERLISIANQQLRLAGNVSNAIVALETAQGRLARADRPRFASVQQAINGDLDHLRAVNVIDIPAQSARIERLIGLVGRAPLLVPDLAAPGARPAGEAAPAHGPDAAPFVLDIPADAAWWERWRAHISSWPGRAGSALRGELGDLIRVQRVDQPAALMLSAEQAAQVRSTLRQRLLTVQLALLMRQPVIWKNETENVSQTLATYYDGRSPETVSAVALIRELAATEIAIPVPDLSNSLSAVAALRAQAVNSQGQDN